MAKKTADIIALMEFYGVEFYDTGKKELVADCFNCDKEKHLYVNPTKGVYKCHRCGTEGNAKSFLGFLWKTFSEGLNSEAIKLVCDARKIPYEVVQNAQIGYHKGMYIFPVLLSTGEITDLRYYQIGKKVQSSAGAVTGIYNGAQLFNTEYASYTIWITEGEFDCLVLNHLFQKLNIAAFAVSIPGVNNFKSNWAPFFIDRKVVLAFDNDSAGAAGVQKANTLIAKGVTTSLEKLEWPEDFPSGYDVSDFLVAYAYKEGKYKDAWELLKKLIVPADKKEHLKKKYDIDGRVTFSDLMKKYRQYLDINQDFETLIKVCIATVLSGKITSQDPVWLFIVGPPGYGKTAVLSSFKDAGNCYYQSTISRHNLVSGFKTVDGTDPSILGIIGDRCLILKDYTEILAKSKNDREEISGIFRGAFDGFVERDFGNGVKRRYVTNFPMLAGVTDLIKHHSDAELGERMIRFNLNVTGVDFEAQGEKALLSSITGGECRNELQQYVAYYMEQDFGISEQALLTRSTKEFRSRVINLAKLIAHLRTKVTRHEKGILNQSVSFRPRAESANRLAIQFQRLALALTYVEEVDYITAGIYKLIKRIGFDTVDGYTTDICKFLFKVTKPVERGLISDALKIPKASLPYYLEDLELTGAINKKIEMNGVRKIFKYYLSPELVSLWSKI